VEAPFTPFQPEGSARVKRKPRPLSCSAGAGFFMLSASTGDTTRLCNQPHHRGLCTAGVKLTAPFPV
jgi:hypothetical protein